MRGDGVLGRARSFLIAAVGRVCSTGSEALEKCALVPVDSRSSRIAFPFVAATFGWMLTEIGRQPWIVQGLLKTADANSPSVSTTWLAISLTVVRAALHRAARRRLRADAALREPRPGRRASREERGAGAALRRSRTEMDLQIFWFVLIAVLWGGYFLLEGFDFGVGMLLPFLPRDERERGDMFEHDRARSGTATRSGSWSPAARRSRPSRPGTRRCSRASTSRCCSSSSS